MANINWVGGAAAVAQVQTNTFGGTWLAPETVTVTIGQKTVVFTVGSTSIATITSNLASAWNALSGTIYPEFQEITANAGSTTLILTADTPGKPFMVSISTNSASGTITPSATTANASSQDWSTATNWSGGAVPANGDSVTLDRIGTTIFYGLNQSAVTLASLVINTDNDPAFILGLPKTNADGTQYPEYRPDYLRIGATLCTVTTAGGRTKIDFGSAQTTCEVLDSGATIEDGVPAVLLKGTHASNSFLIQKGDVALGFFAGESSTALTFSIGQISSAADASVQIGSGVTLGTITQYSGTLVVNCAITTALVVQGGRGTTINGTGAVADITATAARVTYSTSGTLSGTVTLTSGSLLDFSKDLRAKTVSNTIQCFDSADVLDQYKVVSSLAVKYNKTSRLGLGNDITLTRS